MLAIQHARSPEAAQRIPGTSDYVKMPRITLRFMQATWGSVLCLRSREGTPRISRAAWVLREP